MRGRELSSKEYRFIAAAVEEAPVLCRAEGDKNEVTLEVAKVGICGGTPFLMTTNFEWYRLPSDLLVWARMLVSIANSNSNAKLFPDKVRFGRFEGGRAYADFDVWEEWK